MILGLSVAGTKLFFLSNLEHFVPVHFMLALYLLLNHVSQFHLFGCSWFKENPVKEWL